MRIPYQGSRRCEFLESALRTAFRLACALGLLATTTLGGQTSPGAANRKVRLAIVGLNHDHVWGILKNIAGEKDADLVAIAESDPALVNRAKARVPESVRFFDDFVKMLDDMKPDAVIAT